MQDELTKINLNSLRRIDSTIDHYVYRATHCGVYRYCTESQNWEKLEQDGVEGPLFIAARVDEASFDIFVLNRASFSNFQVGIPPNAVCQALGQSFVQMQLSPVEILGVWFKSEEESQGFLNTIQTILPRITQCFVKPLSDGAAKLPRSHSNPAPSNSVAISSNPQMSKTPNPPKSKEKKAKSHQHLSDLDQVSASSIEQQLLSSSSGTSSSASGAALPVALQQLFQQPAAGALLEKPRQARSKSQVQQGQRTVPPVSAPPPPPPPPSSSSSLSLSPSSSFSSAPPTSATNTNIVTTVPAVPSSTASASASAPSLSGISEEELLSSLSLRQAVVASAAPSVPGIIPKARFIADMVKTIQSSSSVQDSLYLVYIQHVQSRIS
eukprot:ANDGO_07487.mRNA.1 Dcp1 family decapping family protein